MIIALNIICNLLSLTILIDFFTKKKIYSITNTKFYKWLPTIVCNILYALCISLAICNLITHSTFIGVLSTIGSVYTSLYCYILIINIKKGNNYYA